MSTPELSKPLSTADLETFVNNTSTTLPFDPAKQRAILGHILQNRAFFLQCKTKLLPEWFDDIRCGKVYRAALAIHRELGRPPTRTELKGCKEILVEEAKEVLALQSTIDVVWVAASEIGLDFLRPELTDWYHARLYREGVIGSLRHFNSKDFRKAFSIMDEKASLIRSAKFDEAIELSFAEPEKFLAASEESYKEGLTTGLSLLDAALTPDGQPNPGLYVGDTTVLLAPSNVGKTTTLITIAVHNVLNKVPTLLLTHEGRPADIREKILCSVLRRTKPELFAMYKTPEGAKAVRHMAGLLENYLTYIPYNKAGMQVEEVSALIRRRQEERIAQKGEGYKLLVDDYPAKLSTERAKSGALAQRNLDAVVYDYFVQLALELNVHSLLAVQTNRKGSVDNRDSSRLLGMEDVRESWDVMTMATNVLSINRDQDAAQNNRVTFYVCKSRSSQTGRAVVAKSNYAACVTHWNRLGGCWYMGDTTLADQIDQFMKIRNRRSEQNPTLPGVTESEITSADLHAARAAAE